MTSGRFLERAMLGVLKGTGSSVEGARGKTGGASSAGPGVARCPLLWWSTPLQPTGLCQQWPLSAGSFSEELPAPEPPRPLGAGC